MNWKELRQQPDGCIFCESDLPATPLYVKVRALEDDLIVLPVYHPGGTEPCRLGWRGLDACDLNSIVYAVLSVKERAAIAGVMIGEPETAAVA